MSTLFNGLKVVVQHQDFRGCQCHLQDRCLSTWLAARRTKSKTKGSLGVNLAKIWEPEALSGRDHSGEWHPGHVAAHPPFEILLFKVTFSRFLSKLSFQKSETTEKREKTQCTSYHPYNPFTPNPPAVISERLNMTIHSNAIKCISTIFAFHFLESHFQLPTSPTKRAHMCSTTPSPKQPSTTLQQL